MSKSTKTSVGDTDTSGDVVSELYEPLVVSARERYVTADSYQRLVSPDAPAEFLDRFLIEFCALGVSMTRPVDDWIRRSGTRCIELGLSDLGHALQRHAEHEADHHLMMINDTHSLVELWNNNAPSTGHLDAEVLLAREPSAGCVTYVNLHEHTIASDAPWGQLAIEFEIERLSITAGALLLQRVAEVCGPDRIAALSFLADHVAVDEAHTVFNRRQLNTLLAEHPDFADSLGAAGAAALDAHSSFIADCVANAS